MAILYFYYLFLLIFISINPITSARNCYFCLESYTNGIEEVSKSYPKGCTVSTAKGKEIAKLDCSASGEENNYCYVVKAYDRVFRKVFIVNRSCGSKDICDKVKDWPSMDHKDIAYCEVCETDYCNDKKEGNSTITTEDTDGGSNCSLENQNSEAIKLSSNLLTLLTVIIVIICYIIPSI